jgi:hypothetical protein
LKKEITENRRCSLRCQKREDDDMSARRFFKKTEDKHLSLKKGRMHFSKEIERKLFFFLTLAMVMMGLLVKIGIL